MPLLSSLSGFLPVVQIVLSILIVGTVLLQTRGAQVGGAFTDAGGSTYYKRRGSELFLFRATIVLGVLFAATSLLVLLA
ncbi:MAG: preprotein translocase subunit SecG [Patescibacteria group bacterium]